MEIKDGGTDLSPNVGLFCRDRPPTQKSTSNLIRIKYYTDYTRPNLGFKAKVSIAKCGGTIHVDAKSISRIKSPSYPAKYPSNTECLWNIVGPVGHFLRLDFDDFNFPENDNCSNTDYLQVLEPNMTADGCKYSEVHKDESKVLFICFGSFS